MIAMQVLDENMINAAAPDAVLGHLHLRTLAAVYQKQLLVHRHHLCGWMAVKGRERRIISEYGNRQHSVRDNKINSLQI